MKKFVSILMLVVMLVSISTVVLAEAAPSDPTVRLALVGAWHVHTQMYVNRVLNAEDGKCQFVAVWDHDAERGKQFAETLNVPYYENLDDVLNNPEINAVMIEAETNLHKDLVIKAANAGKNIFCEKVLTTNMEDALEMKEAVERSGVKFVVSHESIPTSAYMYARKLVDEGALGDIISIYFRRAHGMLTSGDGINGNLRDDWMDKETAGGGALMDLGVHGMSMLPFYAKSKPVKVSSAMREWKDSGCDSSATIMIEFENGAIGVAHTDMITSIMTNNLEILGTRGQLLVVGDDLYLNSLEIEEYSEGMNLIDPAVYAGDNVVPLNWFIDFVYDTENTDQYIPYVGMDEALTVVGIAEAAYESYEQGGIPIAVKQED